MKGMRLVVIACMLAAFAVRPAGAVGEPPPNDDFANAAAIPSTNWNTSTETTGATLESGEPQQCNTITKSVWFKYTADSEMDFIATTQGTSYPTAITAYKGSSLHALTYLRCDYDTQALSDVQITTEPGATYYFQVGPTSAVDGPLTFVFRYMYRVSGTVRDEGGVPVSGICVYAHEMNGAYTYHTTVPITKADGTYTLKYLYPGPHKFLFDTCSSYSNRLRSQWYNGKASSAEADPVTSGPDGGPTELTGVDVTLLKGPAITGTVLDRRGHPASYVCMEVWRNGTYFALTYTDLDGKYAVMLASGSGYKVKFGTCSDDRYIVEWNGDAATQEAAAPITVPENDWATIDAVLDPGGTITGVLTDTAGNLARYQCVEIFDAAGTKVLTTSSGAAGAYDARMLDPGAYKIRFAACPSSAYMPQWYKGSLTAEGALPVTISFAGQDVADVDDVLDPGGIIRGKVTSSNGDAVSSDCVGLYDASGKAIKTASTSATGTYAFVALQPGSYKVRFGGCNGDWLPMWYSGKTSPTDADPVTAAIGTPTEGIDAVLPLRPPPANDERAAAAVVAPGLFRDTRDTIKATAESGEPGACTNTPAKATVWYRFTAPSTGTLFVWTIGSDYDTAVAAYPATGTGPPVDTLRLACADDWRNEVGEQLRVPVVAGQAIDIQVGAYYAGGTLKLTAQFTALG